jgi:SAM-dependent methyltransferase
MTLNYPVGQGLAEYRDAEGYERDNAWGACDDFYLNLALETGGPVLDAGCGTGLLARAMSQAGLEVTGVDVTPEMLDFARRHPDGQDVEWVLADMRTMQLGKTFRLILMNGHSFQHLLSDADIGQFLDRAREHLLPEGWLAFETRNFAARSWGQSGEPDPWGSFENDQGEQIDEVLASDCDPQSGIETLTFIQTNRVTGDRNESVTLLRYLSAEHLNELLQRHGFTVVHQYGDWDKGPLGEEQKEVVSICRLASR